jgi:hypothetical protein
LQASVINQRVAAVVPEILVIGHLASRFGPNPLSPKAKEQLIAAVVCQECTQTQGFALKAKKTEAKSARC